MIGFLFQKFSKENISSWRRRGCKLRKGIIMEVSRFNQVRGHIKRWYWNWNANWGQLHKRPLKIIPSKNDGPYAFQTTLGWCALGPRQSVGRQNSLKFNSVAVKDESTSTLARHRFFIENARKNMGEEQIFQRMYHIYFNGKKNLIGKMQQHIEQLQTKSFWTKATMRRSLKDCGNANKKIEMRTPC